MIPETWLPTSTVVTAERNPVAVTVCATLPRSTFAVRYLGSDFRRPPTSRKTPAAAPRTTATQTNFFMALSETSPRPRLVPSTFTRGRSRRDGGREPAEHRLQ